MRHRFGSLGQTATHVSNCLSTPPRKCKHFDCFFLRVVRAISTCVKMLSFLPECESRSTCIWYLLLTAWTHNYKESKQSDGLISIWPYYTRIPSCRSRLAHFPASQGALVTLAVSLLTIVSCWPRLCYLPPLRRECQKPLLLQMKVNILMVLVLVRLARDSRKFRIASHHPFWASSCYKVVSNGLWPHGR